MANPVKLRDAPGRSRSPRCVLTRDGYVGKGLGSMADLSTTTISCIDRIRTILSHARATALRTANAAMVAAYWHIGREIVEEEQRGSERAKYGMKLIEQLSENLTREFGRGYSVANVRLIRQFYLAYRKRRPTIRDSVSRELGPAAETGKKRDAVSTESIPSGGEASPLSPDLTWTHYRTLMRVTSPEARSFYEVECAKAGWSVRELQRQIDSMLFERLARSRDKDQVLALARDGHEVQSPSDLVKDPYVMEFVGLPEASRWLESDFEQALIDRLQQFLLELGRDLFFVARQKRITIDGDHFYVDLVFYHRELRCFLLVDLKMGRLTQQDIGQMLLYTGYYEAEEKRQEENPPIGLILCADKNEAVVRYTLSQTANQVFASRYQLHLPSEEELAEELQQERLLLKQHAPDQGDDEDHGDDGSTT
jgi:predicted nuclease of restriction endonuclease-like (RecB) superfamily